MAPEELVNAVHRVLLGRKYITPSIAEKLAEQINEDNDQLPHEQLSDREFEVLKFLAAGKSLTEIIGRTLHQCHHGEYIQGKSNGQNEYENKCRSHSLCH